MFREMRRKKQQLTPSEAEKIIKSHCTCTLALAGDDGYPYSLPISYAYIDGKIYFHCAKVGHKIDAIKSNERVSLSIIESDEIIEEKFTNKYKSVIVFGKARIIEDKNESGYVFYYPDLPGYITYGETTKECGRCQKKMAEMLICRTSRCVPVHVNISTRTSSSMR